MGYSQWVLNNNRTELKFLNVVGGYLGTVLFSVLFCMFEIFKIKFFKGNI